MLPPAIEGTNLDGKVVSLADLKGNVVLVVFWAS
jgi:cytochrome oxidase Cu insertion factor (SCO1/SenC/PrrC family)